jgi:hypothetical protein
VYAEYSLSNLENMYKLEIGMLQGFFCGARYRTRFLPPAGLRKDVMFEKILTGLCLGIQVFRNRTM